MARVRYMVLLSAWTGPFSTEASGTYHPALFKTITDGDTAVIFTVRASNDVHVGYFSELKTYGNGGGLYEIVIGGWRVGSPPLGTKSIINRMGSGVSPLTDTLDILNPNEDRPFWVDAKDGLVRLGKGNTIGNDIIVQWQDPSPLDPIYIGFMTQSGSTGIWSYQD